ncbi:hypothetical protein FKM82_016252 [Ascaphus truei]
MASSPDSGDAGLLRGARTRSYGSLVQSPYSPARVRKVEHRIQQGDTLQGLALKYGVTMEQIKRTNRLYTNDSIFLKKSLYIPVVTDQLDFSIGLEGAGEGLRDEGSASRPEKVERQKGHSSTSQTGPKEDLSATDFLRKLDTRIRVSKRAAVKKLQEGETPVPEEETDLPSTGYQGPRPSAESPRTVQRSLLGPVPLTITTRASTIRDHEDEIFKL